MAGKQYSIEFMLGAGLESTFAKSFNTASNSMRELQDKLNLLGRNRAANPTKGVRDDLAKTRQEMQLTQNAADKMNRFVSRSFAAIGGIYVAHRAFAFGKDIVNTFADFEQGMQNVKAISGASNEEMEKLTAQAKELNATTKFDGVQVASGMEFLARAGWNAEKIMAAMPGMLDLAASGALDLGEAADITTNIMSAFGIEAEKAGNVADMLAVANSNANTNVQQLGLAMTYLAPTAATMGQSIEQATAAVMIMSDAGIQGEKAGAAFSTSLQRLANPTKDMTATMERLGISFFDAQGDMKPMTQIVADLEKATANYTKEQTAQALSIMFGAEAYKNWAVLVETGSDALEKNVGLLQNADGAAAEMANTMMDSFSGAMERMNSAINAAKVSIGEKMAPTIRNFAENVAETLPGIIDKFEATWAAMTSVPSWQNADWVGKIQIAWDKLISSPFRAWWQAQGKAEFEKVAAQIGKAIKAMIGGVVKEAFTGSGATQILAAGAIGLPAINAGKGILNTASTIKSLLPAGTEAAKGVGGATKAVSLFGPALGLLLNPIGLTVAGIGALAAGVIAYKKHQEKARQELINMGSTLREAEDRYEAAADKAELTTQLADEYRTLNDQVSNNAGSAEELANAQQRMAEITATLQDMFPQTITNYDIEKGKMLDKLGLLEQMTEAEKEMEKLRLESVVAEKSSQKSKLEKEIGKLEEQVTKAEELKSSIEAQKDAIDAAIPKFQEYENELVKLSSMDRTPEVSTQIENLIAEASKLGSSIGWNVHGLNLFGTADNLKKSLEETNSDLKKAIEKQIEKMQELDTAKASYEELYNAQVNLIELDLGGTLESQAEKFGEMSEAQQEAFMKALEDVAALNRGLELLPSEKKINVQVVYDEALGVKYAPQHIKESAVPNYKIFDQYADGGFANKPSIFGEAGLEAAIPINNKPRSHALLDQVNRMMGHDRERVINDLNVAVRYEQPYNKLEYPTIDRDYIEWLHKTSLAPKNDVTNVSDVYHQQQNPYAAAPNQNNNPIPNQIQDISNVANYYYQESYVTPNSARPVDQMRQLENHVVEGNNIQATYSPQVTIQGNADNSVIKQLQDTLDGDYERFIAMLNRYVREQGRLEFRG